jgi:hypothetical protein
VVLALFVTVWPSAITCAPAGENPMVTAKKVIHHAVSLFRCERLWPIPMMFSV